MAEQFTNDIQTTLSGGINSSVTSLSVASATGFPTTAQYRIRIENELLLVTAGAGTTTWTVARGAEGSTPAAHSNGVDVHHVLTAGAIRNVVGEVRNPWLPVDNGLLATNYDPGLADSQFDTQDGEILWSKVWVPVQVTVSNLVVLLGSPGSGFSAGNFGGVWSSAGTLIAKTGEQSDAGEWDDADPSTKSMPLSVEAGQSLTFGGVGVYVICGVMSRATTNPTFKVRVLEEEVNMNLSGLSLRSASDASNLSQTTIPSTITAGNQTATFRLVWMGLS